VALVRDRALAWKIPLDREHIIGHYQVASDRTYPGLRFPWDALMRDLASVEPTPPKERHMKDWVIVGLENEMPDAYLFDGIGFNLIPDAVVQEDLRKLIYENNIIEIHKVTWDWLGTIGYTRMS
jgi:hypothetical protein